MMRALGSCAALVLCSALFAQRSPFNGLEVMPPDSNGHYRLIISGHFHGSSSNRSGFPASTLLAALDTINALGANMMLSTGDLFMDPQGDIARYRSSLISKLKIAFFNAPGNHDVGSAYEQAFGAGHQLISIGRDRIILFDTERDNGSIKGDQLVMLEDQADGFSGRLFVVSHRPIWAEDDARYGPLFEGNTRSTLPTNFQSEIEPLLERIALNAEVYWISGSMAGNAPASFFFQPHTSGITYIQSAIRNEPRDALLLVDVDDTGIAWSALSLTGRDVLPVQVHDAAWWSERSKRSEPFNWRLLPYLTMQTIRNSTFWYGLIMGFIVLWVVRRLIRRWL